MSRREVGGGAFAAALSAGTPSGANSREARLRRGDVTIHYRFDGQGPPIVMLPSLGRGGEDFDLLARSVADAGFQAIRPQPRGIGASAGPFAGLTLDYLALDVAAVLDDLGLDQTLVVGHAFGNRVARRLATLKPHRIKALMLLASGGKVHMAKDIEPVFLQCFDLSLPDQVRLQAIRKAFFAPGNDPTPWRTGWWRAAAEAQIRASERTPLNQWWAGGGRPILVLQGLDDVLAPPKNARILKAELGDQVTVVDIPHAGHAMLPEQPQLIAEAVTRYASARLT